MGGGVRFQFVIVGADGRRHALGRGVGHLIQQHRLGGLPPQIGERALGEGVHIHHAEVVKGLLPQHPVHGAQLVEGQRPRGVRAEFPVLKGAAPHLHPGGGKLVVKGGGYRGVGHQRHGAVRVLLFGAGKGNHDAAIIAVRAPVGLLPLPVALQHREGSKNQVHCVPPVTGRPMSRTISSRVSSASRATRRMRSSLI